MIVHSLWVITRLKLYRLTYLIIRYRFARMAPIPVRPLVDRILDGQLDALLLDWTADGMSPNAISRKLLVEHDLDIGEDTVRKWIADASADEVPA